MKDYKPTRYIYITLLRATTKGVFRSLRRLIDSIVCGSRPCIMSITRMAISQRDDPRERRLLKHCGNKNRIEEEIHCSFYVTLSYK